MKTSGQLITGFSRCFFLAAVLITSCTLIPKGNRLSRPIDEREVTVARVCGYILIGLPRDLADLPFTVINRLVYFNTPEQTGVAGVRFSNSGEPSGVPIGEAIVAGEVVMVIELIRDWSFAKWFWGTPQAWLTIVGTSAYPVTVAPIEDLLFRWPHNKSNLAIGYRALEESPHYDYFPNIDLFFPSHSENAD